MKIVNRTEFLKLPSETLYCIYKPCIFSDLEIKLDTIPNANDWYYKSLVGNVKCNDSGELADILTDAEDNKTSFKLDFNCIDRNGMFDESELFAVYEKEDIQGLINALKQLI